VAERYVLGSDAMVFLNVEAVDLQSIPAAMEDIRKILRVEHNLKSNEADDFMLRDMGTVVSSATSSSRTMSFLLGSVAAVVLVVGGIGIMNIMLISVQERTKEIGIRKAVGAKPYHILSQFLFEAIILSVLAAAIGLVVAGGAMILIANSNLSIVPAWWGFMMAFFSSVLIGVFFGYYPAKKAAALNPVEALR